MQAILYELKNCIHFFFYVMQFEYIQISYMRTSEFIQITYKSKAILQTAENYLISSYWIF